MTLFSRDVLYPSLTTKNNTEQQNEAEKNENEVVGMIQKNGNGIEALDGVTDKDVLRLINDLAKLYEKDAGMVIAGNREILEVIQCPDAVLVEAVKQSNGLIVQNIKNPSEAVQLAAVEVNGKHVFKHIQNPSETVQLQAVNESWQAIQYIKNPSESVQLAAVKQNGQAIGLIQNPSESAQLACGKQVPIPKGMLD